MHATWLANHNTSISQFHNYSTSTTLISPSSYLKTIIKYQTSHSIQCTLYESFIIPILDAHHIRTNLITKANCLVVLKDSQNNISEAWEINNFYKINHHRALKRYKWSDKAKLSSSKDISEAQRVFRKWRFSMWRETGNPNFKWYKWSTWSIL